MKTTSLARILQFRMISIKESGEQNYSAVFPAKRAEGQALCATGPTGCIPPEGRPLYGRKTSTEVFRLIMLLFALWVSAPGVNTTYSKATVAPSDTSARIKADPGSDMRDMNKGLEVCHKVTTIDDCLKIPFREFTEKYGKQLTIQELKRFRIGQIAQLKVHLNYLKALGAVLEAENKKAAIPICSELFKQFDLKGPPDVCVEYMADMIWDLRENEGRRLIKQLKQLKNGCPSQ